MQLWGKVLGIRSSWARFREADIWTGFLRLGCIWAGSEVDIAGQVDYGLGKNMWSAANVQMGWGIWTELQCVL